MNCPSCHQDVETGAAFCGNCGAPLQIAASNKTVSEIAHILHNQAEIKNAPHGPWVAAGAGGLATRLPSYAFTKPSQHVGETRALLSLLMGTIGIIAAIFMPLIGLCLSITGIIMGTMSRSSAKRGLSTVGIIVSSLAILFSIGAWIYNYNHAAATQDDHQAVRNSSANFTADVSTPCYSTGFADKLNVKNNSGSCDMIAFNGSTMDDSTNAYKIYANKSQIVNDREFVGIAKQALEKDVKANLPGFSIVSQKATQFAGSPAYAVTAYNKDQGVSVIEEAVFHQVKNGESIFVIVHAINGSDPNLNELEGQWQWK
ncbi:MAG: zinc-ribbon domain-containing protein [Patescibacteria group bacterium]